MRITSLKIERFGVWENLSLPKVSPGLNVFFGPNEAGKTTLMQYIRTCLYGGGDEDRARYIQMALDGRRRRGQNVGQSKSDDPRRVAFNASFVDQSDSNVPEEVRRFLEAGKRAEKSEASPVDAKDASRDVSRAWIGGVATLSTEYGDHRVERRYIRRDASYLSAVERRSGFVATDGLVNWSGRFYSLPGQKMAESLVITGPDGTRVGDYFVKSLTCNLDESTYNGVFAIGLDELQRLGMLNETEAAQMLYRLSVGVDRGSFVQVFQQIVAERNDMLDVKDKPSILSNLLSERDRARQASNESAADLKEYARLLEERRALQEAIENLQDRRDKTTRQKRLRELALQIAPVWDEREARRDEIAAMGETPQIEQSAVDECDVLTLASSETSEKIKSLRNSYRAKRAERDAIWVDPAFAELAPRVTILEDDLSRLTEIDAKVDALRLELDELNSKLAEEEHRLTSARHGKLLLTQSALDAINATIATSQGADDRLKGHGVPADAAFPKLPNQLAEAGAAFKEIEDFKRPAKRARRARLRLQSREAELGKARERLNGLVAKLEQGLTSHGQKNLTEAIDRTGALLAGLRRRVEIDKRVNEMTAYQKELIRQNHALVENQAIVGTPLYALGAGVVVGGLLFGLSLFYNRVDLVAGLIGLLVMIGCIFYKTTVERRNRMKLEDNQRRMGLLAKQLEQAREESEALDQRFPAPAGQTTVALDVRLQRAKADLAFFESLAPVEAQWREATKAFRREEERVAKATASLKKARKGWRVWLRNAYLPENLKPRQVRDLFARVEIADDLRSQISSIVTEIEFLGRERQGIVDRTNAAIALVPNVTFADRSPFVVTPKLRELLDEHADVLKARAALLDEMNSLKKSCKKLLVTRRHQSRETRRFLASYNVETRAELVEHVERYALYCQRVNDLKVVSDRLVAGIGGFCQEDELASLLTDSDVRADIPTSIDGLNLRLEGLEAELKGKLELLGRLGQQADAIAAKKDSIRARFNSVSLDLRLARMAELWQSRAVAGQMMEDIRRAYEKERQPETLREASRYLKRLTNGLYVNIWTPLGEDNLFVDAANGETLEVAALSRGTRELLFIAIRLALVVSFEKHGVQMPLIWDDVLVNFDYRRAAIAAKLLCEFASAGRQIFLFTCHEHICRLFLRLGRPVCVLPTSTDPKGRRFRILTPLKKRLERGEAELSVNVEDPVELSPNFVERPVADANSTRFAVEGSDFEALLYPTDVFADQSSTDDYRLAEPSADTESVVSSEASSVDESVASTSEPIVADVKLDSISTSEATEASESVETHDSSAVSETCAKSETPRVDMDTAVFMTSPEPTTPESTLYSAANRKVTLDGESVKLRSLSEVSSTFTARSDSKTPFEVVTERERTTERTEEKEVPVDAQNSVGDVDYVTVDESTFEDVDSLDFDEWTNVFSEQKKSGDDSSDGDFADFLEPAQPVEEDLDEYDDSSVYEDDSDEYDVDEEESNDVDDKEE